MMRERLLLLLQRLDLLQQGVADEFLLLFRFGLLKTKAVIGMKILNSNGVSLNRLIPEVVQIEDKKSSSNFKVHD